MHQTVGKPEHLSKNYNATHFGVSAFFLVMSVLYSDFVVKN